MNKKLKLDDWIRENDMVGKVCKGKRERRLWVSYGLIPLMIFPLYFWAISYFIVGDDVNVLARNSFAIMFSLVILMTIWWVIGLRLDGNWLVHRDITDEDRVRFVAEYENYINEEKIEEERERKVDERDKRIKEYNK